MLLHGAPVFSIFLFFFENHVSIFFENHVKALDKIAIMWYHISNRNLVADMLGTFL